MPFTKLADWLSHEKKQGVDSICAILATCTSHGAPHSRVVAIREVKEDSLLFFTQQKTRKVRELITNPAAALNFLLDKQQRQIILEGRAESLSAEENKAYWEALSRERQLRFSTYAPTSGEVIQDLEQLEQKKRELDIQYANQPLPMSEYYYGFRFSPETFVFYTLGSTLFSKVVRYSKNENNWSRELLSP